MEPTTKLRRRKPKPLPRPESIQELQSLISNEDGPEFLKKMGQTGSIRYSSFRVPAYRITQAATYIEDAIKVRKPQKRITEKGILEWLTPLYAYQFCHCKSWKLFIFVVIWIHMLLVYEEVNKAIVLSPWWVFITQLICLVILTFNCLIRIYSHDTDLYQSGWTKFLIVVLILDYIRFLLVEISRWNNALYIFVVLLQCFRPYYLIYSARSLRSVVKAVIRSLPKIFDFVWIIAIVVLIFGLIGYELFHDINPKFFGDKETALFSLMVTLTTANFPDVMMEGYVYSPYTVIFFALYIIIIIVILLPTILAVVYQAYHTQAELQFATIQKIQTEALHQAFDCLTLNNNEEEYGESTVSLGSWVDIMKILRPDLSLQHCMVLYTTLRLDEELITHKSPLQAEHILLNRKPGLTLNEFFKLPEFLEVKFEIGPTATTAHRLIQTQTTLDEIMNLYVNQRTFLNRCKSSIYKFRIFMLFIFTSPICDNIIDWIVWLNTMIILSFNWYYVANISNINSETYIINLSYLLDIICCIFIAEMGLKIYSYGIKAFFHHTFLVCDLLLVIITVSIAVYFGPIANKDNYVILLRGIRLLRISRQFPRMRLVFRFFVSLSRAFFILLLTMFCLFYVFAMIGMVLFGGDISYASVFYKYKQAVDLGNIDMEEYWNGVIDSYYYLNNMNDFFHSMVTLMELAVVNNWQVVSGTFIAYKDNDYYRVYFISFYFFAVILLLNIVIAFILDIFITQYSKNFSENSLLYRYKKYVMMSILIHQLQHSDEDFDLLHWHITRKVRGALLMQALFEDNTNSSPPIHIHNNNNNNNIKPIRHYTNYNSIRSTASTVTLKPQPSMSTLSMIIIPKSGSSSVSIPISALSREEQVNLRQTINYDDLQQMPWGHESLTQDFLHLYNNENYFKQKHRLLNRNFADLTKADILTNTQHQNEQKDNQLNKLHFVYSKYFDQQEQNQNDIIHMEGDFEYQQMRFPETFWHANEEGFGCDIGNFEPIV